MKELELLRWALADHAFREADALALHVIEQKIPPGTHMFSACIAGIAVSYCRPFLESEGLGPLPKAMKQFKGETYSTLLENTHNVLMEARHKFAAHFERTHAERLHQDGAYQFSPSEIIVELAPVGSTITTVCNHINPVLLEHARGLFLFQMERVAARLGKFGLELLAEKRGQFGRFTFKVPGNP